MTDKKDKDTAALLQQMTELRAANEALRQQSVAATEREDTLNQFIMRVAGASSVEEVLKRGFETLSSQLAPLRDLTPKRTLLSEAALNQLRDLRTSLDRPDWSNGRAFTDDDLDELSPDDRIEPRGEAL
jgi:Ribonuclease G/E